jgi:hypothetical protein
MTKTDWLKLVAGFALGVFGKWIYDAGLEFKRRYKLRRKYGKLARTYANLREGITPTGGHIQMTQRWSGAFDVVAYDQENEIEWRSKINMSLEDEDLGTGTTGMSVPQGTMRSSRSGMRGKKMYCMWWERIEARPRSKCSYAFGSRFRVNLLQSYTSYKPQSA